jgi:hypothetical protein
MEVFKLRNNFLKNNKKRKRLCNYLRQKVLMPIQNGNHASKCVKMIKDGCL